MHMCAQNQFIRRNIKQLIQAPLVSPTLRRNAWPHCIHILKSMREIVLTRSMQLWAQAKLIDPAPGPQQKHTLDQDICFFHFLGHTYHFHTCLALQSLVCWEKSDVFLETAMFSYAFCRNHHKKIHHGVPWLFLWECSCRPASRNGAAISNPAPLGEFVGTRRPKQVMAAYLPVVIWSLPVGRAHVGL